MRRAGPSHGCEIGRAPRRAQRALHTLPRKTIRPAERIPLLSCEYTFEGCADVKISTSERLRQMEGAGRACARGSTGARRTSGHGRRWEARTKRQALAEYTQDAGVHHLGALSKDRSTSGPMHKVGRNAHAAPTCMVVLGRLRDSSHRSKSCGPANKAKEHNQARKGEDRTSVR